MSTSDVVVTVLVWIQAVLVCVWAVLLIIRSSHGR